MCPHTMVSSGKSSATWSMYGMGRPGEIPTGHSAQPSLSLGDEFGHLVVAD
ncbi:hypothetical protein [Streptomyces sp. NPDC049970]|uniref:hypothetical protein n=1 Tax=Streptomyces sp. NPDC049970 TaxID=3155033 RepID=UPI0034128153